MNLPTSDQEAFLREKCLDDESLRQEIELLLAEDARCSGFLQTDSGASAAPALMLATGTRLGPYEIHGIIGTGGMGEVYRAHDTKLRRDVALKVLPQSFANDRERITRFRREARLLAALNHPNIASIYGLEESNGGIALVMELVEGQTLAERITSEPLRIEEALRVAKQIADALEAAHERGIVHRDLKPANVKITPEGVVKVLDFGLGKILKPGGSPTATRSGVILGTAAYMSPEHARGAAMDKRADIWAFGVVLYEVLTRRRPFTGETAADVLASIVKDEPDLCALPPRMGIVITRCLSKEPRNRWGSMGDVRWALDALAASPELHARTRRMRYLPWAVSAILPAAAMLTWLVKSNPTQPLMHMEITAPEGTMLGPVGWGQLALSPDGRRLAFIAMSKDGKRSLWVRSLESGTASQLAGTENVGLVPVWSPDSRWVGFSANGKFQKIDVVAGGPPQTICECAAGAAAWSSQGTILFAMRDQPPPTRPSIGRQARSRFRSGCVAWGNLAGRPRFSPGWKALHLRQLCKGQERGAGITGRQNAPLPGAD
jgi:serine/threonine protein kinase